MLFGRLERQPSFLGQQSCNVLLIDPWGFSAHETHRPLAGASTAFQMSQELFRKWPSLTLRSTGSSGTLDTTEALVVFPGVWHQKQDVFPHYVQFAH